MSSQAKQISDKEKIEIMQHYLDGGEIECKFDEKDWHVVKPDWAWNNCFYRKRIYNYPLYFEFNNKNDTDSEKFIVEFTSLREGTVVQKTYRVWVMGHFDDAWFPHTDKDFWKEVNKPVTHNLNEKFETGDYICLGKKWLGVEVWAKIKSPDTFYETPGFTDFTLIHKRHSDLLEAYLKDRSVEVERRTVLQEPKWMKVSFLETYDETNDYRIKEPESQIVYECYRTDKKTGESEILPKLLTDNMLKILEEDDRTQYTYHKTGRSFEIKLGDK